MTHSRDTSHSSSTPEGGSITGGISSSVTTPPTELGRYRADKDVAVVGMACRVAGGNNSPEQLWEFLLQKKDASGELPSVRWEPYLRRDPRNSQILARTTSRGYFLNNLEDFDAQFFGISPKEAEQMDPQQRISLEVAYEALEDAGIPSKSLSGSDTAVFWGVNSDDYSKLLLEDLPNIEAWMGIGTAYCGVPNRISYHFNLVGPSTAVDAACASSLVAVHHGIQAIVLGESKLAIVGGVNAICGPGLSQVLDRAGAVSSEGKCRSFDDSAQGYGRGEGAAAIILKNMSQAIEDGDHIICVVKGTAVAQDGKTNGIMAPSQVSQQLVAQKALQVADTDPLGVGYVEAHATSTPLGDPTEISAISEIYGKNRKDNSPCFIGSIKPNIGHLEAGAGAVGFIKTAMALKRGVIPPQANLKILNRKINWKTSKLKVVQEVTKWVSPDAIRRAAVCSYGYGGTVSHAVLEEYHPPEPPRLSTSSQLHPFLPSVILLSGSQKKRYQSQAQVLSKWMKSSDAAQNIEGIACTLATRRDHHDYRVAIISDDFGDAINQLESLSQAATSPWVYESRVLATDIKKDVVWVFSGHGAQWPDMGKELVGNPIFYRSIQPLDCLVQDEIGISPVDFLRSGNFESSDQVQILTYFMQIGISAVLNSYGIFPKAVIGHSVGEIAASVVAGALTPEEGTIIIIRRSILYRQVMGQGGMLLVNRPAQKISGILEGISNLCIGIHSSPSSCVVSGSTEAISQALDMFKQASIKVLRVKTDIAFHSPSLNKLRQPLLDSLRNSLLPTSPSSAKLYSTSLKDPRGQDLRDSTYWANNMIKPVHLTSAIQAAVEDSFRIFLEISSHPLVSHSINETLMDAGLEDYAIVPTITREKPSLKSILYSVAQLHCNGVPVEWKSIMPRNWADGVPKTIWMHRPVWRKVETGNIQVQQTHVPDEHTLLGHRVSVAGTDGFIFNTHLDQHSKPFPGSHPLHGTEIVPAAGLLNTFLKATGANVLKNTILRVPVAINAPRSVQVDSFGNDIKISSKLIQDSESNPHEDSWVTHTTAKWEIADLNFRPQDEVFDITGTRSRIGTKLVDNFTVDYLAKVGVSAMGFPWIVTEHYGDTKEMLAHVDTAPGITIDAGVPWDPTSWAPILDAATSVGSTLFFDEPRLRMPAQVDRVDLFTPNNPPKLAWLYVCAATETHMASDVSILDSKGVTLAKISGMRFSEIEGTPGASGSMENLVHHIAWPPALPAEDPLNFDQLIIICQDVYLSNIYSSTLPQKIKVLSFISPCDFSTAQLSLSSASAIVYIPNRISTLEDVPKGSEESTWELLEIIKFVAKNKLPTKVFVVTRSTLDAETVIALAHAPLIGLSRILASEHGDIFGGLIDTEVDKIPLTEMRYIQGADVIRVQDGVARTAALRPLPRQRFLGPSHANKLLPRPGGTYLITGGFGALGLEVADFLVEKGARRIILNSRRSLPPRREWDHYSDDIMPVISKIRLLEDKGASIHVISIDISVPDAAKDLATALENLRLPPVRGVVHAAGVLDNQLALDTTRSAFSRVLDPKITGSLVLHTVFPPQSVDFFILFSSCGQLVGFTGQSSYGSANSFLDALAMHRRLLSDTSVSFQWTSWRGMGMGASTEYIKAELESKGITDVTRDEAFSAWSHLAKYDIDHGVILRSLTSDEGEPAPCAILRDIAIRRIGNSADADMTKTVPLAEDLVPPSGPELKKYLDVVIRKCVAQVLHMDPNEVDSKAALADLGVDSVLTVSLRRQLQQSLKIKVPPTLIWSHPTVNHLVEWFGKRFS